MENDIIMGIPVDNIKYEDILADVPIYLETSKKMTAISINPQIVLEGQKYTEVIEFIKKSTHRIPDGTGIVLVSKLTGGNITERVAGIELMVKFLEYANQNQSSIFLYGAKPDILRDAIINIQRDFPDLIVSGGIDGYTSLSELEIVNEINKVKPEFLFVALGFPRQEQWLSRNVDKLNVSVFQDVGGSFDVLSDHVKRAPQIFIKLHLEWLYRSVSNPKRIGRIFQLPIFVLKSLWWKIRR